MHLSRFSSVLAIVVLAAACAAPSQAQTPLAIDFEDAFSADFARRDLPMFRGDLLLDDEQTAIVESLFADYSEQFDKALSGVRKDLRDAQAALGAEDPEIDRQREDLRGEIAALMEQMQADLQNLPAGGNPAEIRQKYEAQVKDMQTRLEQLRGSPIKAAQMEKLFEDASARLEQWRGVKREMRSKFEGDVQAILREEQKPRWATLQRKLLRQRSMGRGLLQGEGVDLLALAREQQLPAEQQQAIAGALNDYEMRLDAALRARNDLIESSDRAVFKAVQSSDRGALASLLERQMQARVTVRNANDESATAIAAALPQDAATRFRQAYLQRGYPQVFRDTQMLRLMKAAREMGVLSPAQIEALNNMQKSYEQELLAVNDQVLQAVRQHEPAEVALREAHRLLPPGPDQEQTERERGPGGVQQAFAKRNELGNKYDTQLQALLGAELYERLPRGKAQAASVPDNDP